MSPNELPHVGIVTRDETSRLTDEDRAVVSEIRSRGFVSGPAVWSDSTADWSQFDAVVLRSCWDYHTDPETFRSWLETVKRSGTVVINPPDVIQWNVHKFYLRELERAGVPVVPTAYIDTECAVDLVGVVDRNGWTDAVIKPAIGTSSSGVWRTTTPIGSSDEDRFETQLAESDLLVQQFVPEVTDGELSFVFFEGDFSHASCNVPAAGEYRAHPDFGVSTEPYEPSGSLVDQAVELLEAACDAISVDPTELVYARVDGVERSGRLLLMELELIEPYLNLSMADDGVGRFVDAIETALRRRWGSALE